MIIMAIPFGSPSFPTTPAPSLSKIAQISLCKAAATNKWNTALNLVTHSNPMTTFLEHYNVEELSTKRTEKIMEVRHMLEAEGGKYPLKCMAMVDALQRHGIDYHFQEEIEDKLLRLHVTTGRQNTSIYESQHLGEVSLYFRLLRQEGVDVHADVFNNFKNDEGKFIKKMLMKDIWSVRELYEASQLRTEGEHILDEAESLSSQVLSEWMKNVDDDMAEIIANTLRHPCHKSLARLETGHLFSRCTAGNIMNDTWQNTFRELSCMDSFISQGIHRMELHKISKWWHDLGLSKELKLARDQPLKWFAWSMAVLPDDLRHSDERIDLTKSVSLIYVVDDIFDLYGTLEELTLFTQAVNRWELDGVERLPDYMKMSFRALYDITNQTGQLIAKKHGSDTALVTSSLQKAWARLCNAYLVEAKWLAFKKTPKAEEYLKNGITTSGVHVTLVHLFFLLGLGSGTVENAKMQLEDTRDIVSSVALILRLWNDLGSTKDQGEHGHDYSYINYYMKEEQESEAAGHHVSVEMAGEHVIKRISEEWKRLNKECLCVNRTSASFKKGALNLARMVPLMYDYDSHRSLPSLGQYMRSILYNNVRQLRNDVDDDPFHLLG